MLMLAVASPERLIVPLREAGDHAASMARKICPLPVPLGPDVICNHASDGVAVQVHCGAEAITDTTAVDDPADATMVDGSRTNEQDDPNCVTVKV